MKFLMENDKIDMQPYSGSLTKCNKCGGHGALTKYCESGTVPSANGKECLQRECINCGYIWIEKTSSEGEK